MIAVFAVRHHHCKRLAGLVLGLAIGATAVVAAEPERTATTAASRDVGRLTFTGSYRFDSQPAGKRDANTSPARDLTDVGATTPAGQTLTSPPSQSPRPPDRNPVSAATSVDKPANHRQGDVATAPADRTRGRPVPISTTPRASLGGAIDAVRNLQGELPRHTASERNALSRSHPPLPTRFKRRVVNPATERVVRPAFDTARAARRRGARQRSASPTTGFAPPPRWAQDALFDHN